MGNPIENVVDQAVDELKDILKNPKNKGVAVGATLAYLLSKYNKERNAILASLAGYFVGKKEEE